MTTVDGIVLREIPYVLPFLPIARPGLVPILWRSSSGYDDPVFTIQKPVGGDTNE
jgi:hypothetical protein